MVFNIIAGCALFYFCLRDCCLKKNNENEIQTIKTSSTTSGSSLNHQNIRYLDVGHMPLDNWERKNRVISFDLPQKLSESTLPSINLTGTVDRQ